MSAHAEHLAHEEHDHVPVYVKLAVLLSVVTAMEVGVLYIPGMPAGIGLFGLYSLATFKFGLVVAIFMHLKYDNKLLTGIFFSGFTIALATMVALVALINYQPTKTSVDVKDSKQLAALNAGDPKNGPGIFKAKGCVACHTVSSIPEATGAVGPKLDGLAARAGSRKPGMSAEDYIKESVENPTAFVVPTFSPVMPSLRASMSDKEFKDLLSFLKTL